MKKMDDRQLERWVMRVVHGANRYARVFAWMSILALVLVSAFSPDLAFAQAAGGDLGNLCTNAQNAVHWITIGVYFILVVAVLGAGVAAAFGRMEWATVGRILIGCIVAGLAATLVTALFGASGC